MKNYNHKEVEKKWQEIWEKTKIYQPDLDKSKKPFYNLMMFPYPSAEGLHVGNMYAFVHSDTFGRFTRMQGFDVFEPIGLDGFGIHSENYAIKIKEHIKDVSQRTEKHFYEQLHKIGNGYDWSRTVETYKPEYYKWTQWLFLKMYEKGLAYRKKAYVNWCPSCKTVLSDEQIISGECERCGSSSEKREMEQWFWRITDYASKLLANLGQLDWTEEVKTIQKNWIGRSEGATITFRIPESGVRIPVFTTRPDTLFGCTYLVLAPEHQLLNELKKEIKNLKEVEEYREKALKESFEDRTNEKKAKTGVELKGIKAVNPATKEEIPIFVADYVLVTYGTGAIMAVPAHDERDFDFAKKYKLPIVEVILPVEGEVHENEEYRETITAVVHRKKDDKYLHVKWNKFGWIAPPIGGVDEGETPEQAAEREVLEETGYKAKAVSLLGTKVESHFYADNKKVWRHRMDQPVLLELVDDNQEEVSKEEKERHEVIWLTAEEALAQITHPYNTFGLARHVNKYVYTGKGRLTNSGKFDGMETAEAKEKMIEWLEGNKVGKKEVNYKLRDWCISRQRYWGPPIPMVFCEKCASTGGSAQAGWVPVPEKDLPILLPEVEDFLPDGSGKGPLSKVADFVNTTCPKCQGPAKRETDVSDPFVDSSWYFLRYPCTEFEAKALDKERLTKWMPVDMYIGGKEHSVLHLLYSRFVNMVLNEMGFAPTEEPYKKFRAHGLLIKEGAKISKSKGNVVNPDEYIERFGADAVRMYLMFLGEMRLGGDWRDTGMNGMARFIAKFWTLSNEVNQVKKIAESTQDLLYSSMEIEETRILRAVHKTIKKVTSDIEILKFNTAISAIMEALNELLAAKKSLPPEKSPRVWREAIRLLTLVLAPFAPFVTEEIWNNLGFKESVHIQSWPKYDEELLREEVVTIVVQINGKLRANIEMSKESTQNEVEEVALAHENVRKNLGEKKPKKVIYVPEKILNIVV